MDSSGWDGPRPVRRDELVASRRLRALCFPGFVEEVGEEDLVASYTSPRRGGAHVICHQGMPVSQIDIHHSRVSIYGSHLRVASIGGVCTHPDYRRQGLAARLLQYCVRKLTAEGARLMLISGMRGLYARVGCVTAQDFEYVVLKPGQLRSPAGHLSLRPATEADVPICARLYHTEAVHFVRRVGEFTQHFCQLEEFPQAEDWVVEVGGLPLAYMFLSVPWECYHGGEAGVREVFEYAGSRVALAGGLAEVMARLELREMRLHVPWQDVDFLQLLRGQGVTGDPIPLIGHTMRVVNFPGLMADLRAYVKARLTASLRRGLRFEQEGFARGEASPQPCSGVEGDRCAIVQGRERLELDGAAMTRLVMGVPQAMQPDASIGSGSLGEIIPALFPLPSFLPGLNFR
jgi:predicted N-acetyltransferase YhbS